MKKEQMMATQQVATVANNEFKDAQVGFPEGQEMTVCVLGQDADFLPQGRTTPVQMVVLGINPEKEPAANSDAWRPVRVAQGSIAAAIGLVGASEWKAAKDSGKTWRVIAKRDAPTRDQERDGVRGTMRFRLA